MPGVEKNPFKVASVEPKPISALESQQKMLEAIALLQEVERNNMGREEVTIGVKHNDPVMILCASDLHVGSITTDHGAILSLRDYALSHENVGVVLLGDEVEGLKEAYLNTNTARTPIDFQQQIDLLRMAFLKPLAEKGKILTMVSGYWGHPGWAEDATTINTWRIMTDGLNIPIIQNGGQLNLKFANGHTHSLKIWHNPPGSSNFDPVSGLRKVTFSTDERVRTDGAMSGHIHRVGVAKELYAGAKTAVYYISSGTTKGSMENIPRDRYGIKLGLPLSDPMGQGVILEPRTRKAQEKNYPFVTAQHGGRAFEAVQLLDRVESLGIKDELIEKIHAEVEEAPKINFYATSSRQSGTEHVETLPTGINRVSGKNIENPYSKMKMKAPYDSLTYDIQTRLPVALQLIANARLGSSSEGLKDLVNFRESLVDNPHSLILYLRNMIDKEAGKSTNRVEILNNFINLIDGTKEQTLAIMMDESMRMPSWKKPVGDSEEHLPLAPGSYLANNTGIPLIHHLSLIKLAVGPSVKIKEKPLYVGAFADKLMNSGSYAKPTFGLRRTYDNFTHEKPGYLVGGHMPSAGTMTFFDRSNLETKNPILIAPGWWSKFVDTMGRGNVMPGAEPGQAIIFMPGSSAADYLAYPTINASETEYLHDALTLLEGLKILGLTESVMKKK